MMQNLINSQRGGGITPGEIYEIAVKVMPKEDIDHYYNDLYLRRTDVSDELINRLEPKSLVSTFVDGIDHDLWYDLPFCYTGKEIK